MGLLERAVQFDLKTVLITVTEKYRAKIIHQFPDGQVVRQTVSIWMRIQQQIFLMIIMVCTLVYMKDHQIIDSGQMIVCIMKCETMHTIFLNQIQIQELQRAVKRPNCILV